MKKMLLQVCQKSLDLDPRTSKGPGSVCFRVGPLKTGVICKGRYDQLYACPLLDSRIRKVPSALDLNKLTA